MKNRHSIRLKGWDYGSIGKYFVTIDTWHKIKYFGEIINGTMILNGFGKILDDEILNTPIIRKNIVIPVYQIMPDHVHLIINIEHGIAQNLGKIIRGIKMSTATKTKIEFCNKYPIWQRNYYEMIIKNEFEYDRIEKYILNNPKKWEIT